MKKKAQKKCKRIANYKHTVGVINCRQQLPYDIKHK